MNTENTTTQQKNGRHQGLPKLWTANFVFICLSSLFNMVAFHSLIVSLPLYIQEIGGSTSVVGMAIATLTVAAVLIRPFAGLALDKYGRKLIFVVGLILFLLPSVAFIFMVPFYVLMILRFIQGFGWGISHTAVSTVASDIVPPLRIGEGMGIFAVTVSISFAVAPLMSLWLINEFSFHTLFVVIALLTVIAIIFSQAVNYPKFESHPQRRMLELYSKDTLRPALVILLTGLANSSIISYLALFARDEGIGNPGLFFAFMAVTALLSRPASGKLVDNLGQWGFDLVILISIPMMAVSLWIVSSLDGTIWYLAVSGVFLGIGYGAIQSTTLAMCIKLLPDNRGSANAIHGTFLDIGIAVGSILWGVVAYYAGYEMMFRLTIIPVLLCLFIYFYRKPAGLRISNT